MARAYVAIIACTVVKGETARVPAINAFSVNLESDCVRTELPDGITKVIITKNDRELQLTL